MSSPSVLLRPWPWLGGTALEEKYLSLIHTKLGYDLAPILEMGIRRLREVGKAQTGAPSVFLTIIPLGRSSGSLAGGCVGRLRVGQGILED